MLLITSTREHAVSKRTVLTGFRPPAGCTPAAAAAVPVQLLLAPFVSLLAQNTEQHQGEDDEQHEAGEDAENEEHHPVGFGRGGGAEVHARLLVPLSRARHGTEGIGAGDCRWRLLHN